MPSSVEDCTSLAPSFVLNASTLQGGWFCDSPLGAQNVLQPYTPLAQLTVNEGDVDLLHSITLQLHNTHMWTCATTLHYYSTLHYTSLRCTLRRSLMVDEGSTVGLNLRVYFAAEHVDLQTYCGNNPELLSLPAVPPVSYTTVTTTTTNTNAATTPTASGDDSTLTRDIIIGVVIGLTVFVGVVVMGSIYLWRRSVGGAVGQGNSGTMHSSAHRHTHAHTHEVRLHLRPKSTQAAA